MRLNELLIPVRCPQPPADNDIRTETKRHSLLLATRPCDMLCVSFLVRLRVWFCFELHVVVDIGSSEARQIWHARISDSAPFCQVFPMAGGPRQSDYVTAQYVTLPGQQQTLKFPRGASLGDMQKDLCSAFGKYYPFIEAQSQFLSPGASEIVVFVLHVPSEFV